MANSLNSREEVDELLQLRNEVQQLKSDLSDCYELAQLGHWEVNTITYEVTWSDKVRSTFEIPDDDSPPRSFSEFISYVHPDDRHIIENDWRVLMSEACLFTRQFRIITRSGNIRHIRSMVRSVFFGDKLVRLYGVNQDNTFIVTQGLNNNLDQFALDLFQGHELTVMGGYEIDLRTDNVTLSKSLHGILEIESGKEAIKLWECICRFVAPDDRKMVLSMVRDIRNQTPAGEQYRIGKNAFQLQYRTLTPRSRQTKYVISRFIRICENGRPVKINGLIVDITLAKKYEHDLVKSREQFKSLFDNMTQGVIFYNTSGVMLNVNKASEMMTGVLKKDVLGKTLFDFNLTNLNEDGTVMQKEEHPMLSIMRTGEPIHDVVYGIVNPVTKYLRWVRASFIPTSSLLSEGDGFFGLYEDITESRKSFSLLRETNEQLTLKNKVISEANRKLTETKKELRSTLRQLELKSSTLNQMALLLISDLEGKIVEANDRFLDTMGYKRKEVIGLPDFLSTNDIFHSGIHSFDFLNQIRMHISQGKVWTGEMCKRTKTGKLIWLLETIMPLTNDDGKIERFYFFSSEITHLKDREEVITQEKRIAEEAARIKEEFLSMMSHEIRTPLNSVIGFINLLLRKNPREDQMEMVQALKNSSDNLLYLVNSILDYNKLKAGKIEQEQNQFNLFDYIRHLNVSSRMMALENGIQWELKVDSSLPEIVSGDMGRINQILNNLINNALNFTLRGSIHFNVRLQARVEDKAYVVFEISDSGIGIPAEKLDKIFTPFYQVPVHGYENSSGTGLGLSIVKGLVDLLNGHITVRSVLGTGSVFSVELPLQIPPVQEPQMIARESSVAISIKLKGCTVLYVEDVQSNRFVVENVLSDMEVEITSARNGKEALLLTDKFMYDVILMDIQMPELDGYATADAIRQQARGKNKNTPIIAFTAKFYNEELKQNLEKHHIDDIIVKPFNMEVLFEKIAHARENSSALRDGQRKILSFAFYEIALRYNKEKLSAVKKELLHDMEGLEADIEIVNENKTLEGAEIRYRMHRLRPITKNLECELLRMLLDDYLNHTQYSEELIELNQKIVSVVKRVKSALKELPYNL